MSILFVLPFAIYYYPDYLQEEIGVMVGGFVLAFLAPPYGVLRPHPYSDQENNKPFLFRKSKSVGTKNEQKDKNYKKVEIEIEVELN